MLTSKLEAAQQNIRKHWSPHFTWGVHAVAPWAQLAKPLAEATVALVTTCGVYRTDTDVPFAAWHDLGDATFRVLHVDTPPDRLHIAHAHYDHEHIAADLNVALPVDRFDRLVAEGAVGRLYPWLYSFMGFLPEPHQLIAEMAPQVARRLRTDGVDAAFLTPC